MFFISATGYPVVQDPIALRPHLTMHATQLGVSAMISGGGLPFSSISMFTPQTSFNLFLRGPP